MLPTLSQSSNYPRTPDTPGPPITPGDSLSTIKASSNRTRPMLRSSTTDSAQDYFSSAGVSSSQFTSRIKQRLRPLRSPSLPIPRDSSSFEIPPPVFSSDVVSESPLPSPLPSPSTTPPRANSLDQRPFNAGYVAQQQPPLTPTAEKKRSDLQLRVWKTRLVIPEKIAFRVFREPEECIEADQVLDRATPV